MPSVRGISQRKNFVWNLIGTGVYSLSQWGLLVLLAHTAGPAEVGQFTLFLAISAPVFLMLGLNLRVVLATDIAGRWRMNDFFAIQPVVNGISAIITLVIAGLGGLSWTSMLALAALTVAKSIENRSQIYYGYFQRYRRFDLIAVSLLARGIVGPLAFSVAALLGDGLLLPCVCLACGWFLCQRLLDKRNADALSTGGGLKISSPEGTSVARLRSLARHAAPLGLDKGVSSLAINVPRYAVQALEGTSQLGVYGAVGYLGQATSLLTSSLSSIYVSPLAVHYHHRRVKAFARSLLQLAELSIVILILAPIAAWFFGAAFLNLTLGPEYADRDLLVAVMISAGLTNLQRSLCKALEASHRFKVYLFIDVVTTATIAATAYPFVQAWGLIGAAWALSAGFLVGTILVLCAIARILSEMRKSPVVRPSHAR